MGRFCITRITIFFLVTGVMLGYGVNAFMHRKSSIQETFVAEKGEVLRFTNPQLWSGSKYPIGKQGYAPFKTQLLSLIEAKKKRDEVTEVSVYFRDLYNGPTLGIGEHVRFAPASLLKLPLLITFIDLAEDHPNLMETQVPYKGQGKEFVQIIPPQKSLQENTSYTIAEALRYMIEYSDNHAYYMLLEYLQKMSPENDLLKQTYVDLGIIDPKDIFDETLSVKGYASIFLQLYHGSYLRKIESSEKALDYLTHVDFKNGLVAGVPVGIPVAHKFGEREGFAGGVKQLHDCGIVYYPGNPYLLCVMTRGKDIKKLEETISTISNIVYREFNSRKL